MEMVNSFLGRNDLTFLGENTVLRKACSAVRKTEHSPLQRTDWTYGGKFCTMEKLQNQLYVHGSALTHLGCLHAASGNPSAELAIHQWGGKDLAFGVRSEHSTALVGTVR